MFKVGLNVDYLRLRAKVDPLSKSGNNFAKNEIGLYTHRRDMHLEQGTLCASLWLPAETAKGRVKKMELW